jgi:DNA-directed RNA polymerase specialized sigma24 family protein
MELNKVISENYNLIKSICRLIDRNNYEDLSHEVVIKLIGDSNFIKAIDNSKEKAYIWKVAKNHFLDGIVKINLISLEEVEITLDESINYTNELNDIILENKLTHIEQLWLKAFLERDLNSCWVQSSTGISRQHAKERFDQILNKLRQ